MFGNICNFNVQSNGLLISITEEGRKALQEHAEDNGDSVLDTDETFFDVIEHQLCNGWERVTPEQLGALTDAPILTQYCTRDAHGNITNVGDVYAFMNYQIQSPARELLNKGSILLPVFRD